MSYTLTTAVTELRYLLNETSAVFWSDSELQNWVKDAVIDLSTKLLCVVGQGTITLVDTQYEYTTSDESWIATCLKPKGVFYTDSSGSLFGMQKIKIQEIGHDNRSDPRPVYYHFDSELRKFFIFPIPDSTIDTTVINVVYSYSTDDITLIKDEYQQLVLLYATYKARLKERLYQEALFNYQLYMQSINFERQDKYDLGLEPKSDFQVP